MGQAADGELAKFHVTTSGGRRLVSVAGEVDMSNADLLHSVVSQEAGESSDVTVDLSGVSFMDSRAISALVKLHHELGQGRLRLVCSQDGAAARAWALVGLQADIAMHVPDHVVDRHPDPS